MRKLKNTAVRKCPNWALNWDLTIKPCWIQTWAGDNFFLFGHLSLSSRMPRDMVGLTECLGGSCSHCLFYTVTSFPTLTAQPHPFPVTHDGKSLTVLRTFLYCRSEERKKAMCSLQRGKSIFDETSCVVIVKLGLPQSGVMVACCCLSHGLSSKSHVLWHL